MTDPTPPTAPTSTWYQKAARNLLLGVAALGLVYAARSLVHFTAPTTMVCAYHKRTAVKAAQSTLVSHLLNLQAIHVGDVTAIQDPRMPSTAYLCRASVVLNMGGVTESLWYRVDLAPNNSLGPILGGTIVTAGFTDAALPLVLMPR